MSANQPIRPAQVWIVADDLTGACDAAVAFAQRGARTQVLLDAQAIPAAGAEVVALSTGTRDLPAEQATHHLGVALSRLAVAPSSTATIFKKIDSVLRGNTFHEIRATIAAYPEHLAILAPAYPAQARITLHGEVIATDLTGRRTIPFLARLRAIGIHPTHIPASLSAKDLAATMRGARILLCDATGQPHLEAIVAAAGTLDRPVLWIGSAGLAHALATSIFPAQPARQPVQPRGRLAAFIGSDHPVTLRQLEHLHAQHRTAHWNGDAWDDSAPIAVMRIERGVTTETQIRRAAERLEGRTACLFLTGGDTATQVCSALGIHALCLQHEFASGVPQATAMGGPFTGVTIVLKSGGFGEEHLLTDIAQHFNPQEARL